MSKKSQFGTIAIIPLKGIKLPKSATLVSEDEQGIVVEVQVKQGRGKAAVMVPAMARIPHSSYAYFQSVVEAAEDAEPARKVRGVKDPAAITARKKRLAAKKAKAEKPARKVQKAEKPSRRAKKNVADLKSATTLLKKRKARAADEDAAPKKRLTKEERRALRKNKKLKGKKGKKGIAGLLAGDLD